MDDSTEVRRNRNGDAESSRTIPEFTGGPVIRPRRGAGAGKRHPHQALFAWAGLLIGRSYRCHQARREGKTPAEVRLGRDMTDDAIDALDALDAMIDDADFLGLFAWVEERQLTQDASAWGDFLDWLGALDLADPVDRRHAAHAFDGYVRQVAGDVGWYVTPDPPVNLMLDLAAPAPGERVYDPCFGYGGLLAGAVRRMQAANRAATAGQRVPLAAVTGVERSELAYLVGLCRVVLAGATSHCLAYADALEKPVPDDPDAGFDCILAVPPVDSWQAFDDEDDVSPFLRHVMAQLRPGGRAVVALPEWLLFHADSLPMRKKILSDYHVQRVVALPAGAFEPHTAMPMSIVVFSRDEPGESVRFSTVSPMAWEAAREDATAISEGIGDRPASAGSVSTGVESWSVPVSELALRSYELLAKPPDSALDAAIERLLAADPALKVERLADVADITRWEDIGEDEVFESQPNRGVGAILRATDVTGAGLRLPTAKYDMIVLDSDYQGFLRDADLLVPLEDTIGNVELIPSGGDWNLVIVDGTIAVVCAGEGISPQFLAAMLRSPAYSFWFWSHAEGSTIRRLSVDVLRTLRIPAPPAAVQDAVLQELSEQRGDALAVLHRLLSGAKKNPVADWLEKPLPARVVAAADSLDADDLSELASSILAITDTDYRSSGAWLRSARRAARTLKGYDTVPSVSGRLVILEHALVRFHEALHAISRSEEELFDRLRSCTRGMMRLAEQKVVALQRAAKLDVDVNPPEVEAGVPCEVRLRMTNGSVPLRDLQVTARQPDGTATTAEAAYLAEGVTYEIPVAVRAPDSAESHRIDVAWQARHLDAAPHQDEASVYVLVAPSQSVAQGDLGNNPYIVGNPIDRDEMFFGRKGIMDQIRRHVGGDSANVILLEGNRRTGKTSILKRLEQEQEDELPGWVPVYCSFQDVDSVATANVFRLLARQTGVTLADAGIETWIPDLPAPDSGRPFKLEFLAAVRSAFSGGHPYETLSLYLAAAIDAAKPRRLLLMLDEFDKLQEGIDRGITSSQVPENIRHLLQHQPGLGAIITGSRRLKRLREEYWSALFGFGLRIGVSALPEDEARRLVTEPVARRIRYLPQARDRLVALCARHPFLIQSLCSKVFERAAAGSERTITGDAVERASTEMVRDNEHFQTLWGYAGSERRRLILALCDRMSDLPDAVNLDLLAMKFEEYGVPVRDDQDLDDDIAELRELELLEIDESYRGGTYRLSIPLMAEWLRMNVVFDDLVKRARKETNRHAE